MRIAKHFILLSCLLIQVALYGCAGTVTTQSVVPHQSGFSGTNANAGYFGRSEDGRGVISETLRSKYNALIGIYSKGIDLHPFLIPLKPDDGVTLRRMEQGEQTYYIDQEHLAYLQWMERWLLEGKKPR